MNATKTNSIKFRGKYIKKNTGDINFDLNQ